MSETTSERACAVELPIPELPKGEREYRAFLRMLPQLLETLRGRYVAIHDGQLVDSDSHEPELILRVQAKVGYVPIHVGLVTESQPVHRLLLGRDTLNAHRTGWAGTRPGNRGDAIHLILRYLANQK